MPGSEHESHHYRDAHSQRRRGGGDQEAAAIPPERADFLGDHEPACLTHEIDRSRAFVIKPPDVDIAEGGSGGEPVRGFLMVGERTSAEWVAEFMALEGDEPAIQAWLGQADPPSWQAFCTDVRAALQDAAAPMVPEAIPQPQSHDSVSLDAGDLLDEETRLQVLELKRALLDRECRRRGC